MNIIWPIIQIKFTNSVNHVFSYDYLIIFQFQKSMFLLIKWPTGESIILICDWLQKIFIQSDFTKIDPIMTHLVNRNAINTYVQVEEPDNDRIMPIKWQKFNPIATGLHNQNASIILHKLSMHIRSFLVQDPCRYFRWDDKIVKSFRNRRWTRGRRWNKLG